MSALTNDEVLDRAQRWAHLHRIDKYRPKMDQLLDGLSADDQRRVYLCGQRISGGLSIKVLPAANNRKEMKKNEQQQNKQRAAAVDSKPAAAASRSAGAVKKEKAVGTNPRTASSGNGGKSPRRKK